MILKYEIFLQNHNCHQKNYFNNNVPVKFPVSFLFGDKCRITHRHQGVAESNNSQQMITRQSRTQFPMGMRSKYPRNLFLSYKFRG